LIEGAWLEAFELNLVQTELVIPEVSREQFEAFFAFGGIYLGPYAGKAGQSADG